MVSISPFTMIPLAYSEKTPEPNLQTYLEEEFKTFLVYLGTLNQDGPSFSCRYSLFQILPSMVSMLKLRLKFG